MKTQFLVIATVMLGSLALPLSAKAGEGGIAAAAAFHLDSSGRVSDVAVGAAIGKNAAAAGAQLDYTSVLTSTTFSSNYNSNYSSENSSTSSSGGCYYYYCGGPYTSKGSSTSTNTSQSTNTTTYTPVTNVKAFAVGSAGSLNYSPGGGGYYYYSYGPSIYIGEENPASVGTAQANSFNLNITAPGLSYGK